MKVLPITALPDNPLWEVEFAALNHGLVMAGAKVKLIYKLTGISQRRAKLLYRTLRSSAPPLGAVARGDPKFFALANSQTSTAWSIQSAIFVGCYERIRSMTETKLHRGWHLLTAHRCYLQNHRALTAGHSGGAPGYQPGVEPAQPLPIPGGPARRAAATCLSGLHGELPGDTPQAASGSALPDLFDQFEQ
jgi:hypothetical protein